MAYCKIYEYHDNKWVQLGRDIVSQPVPVENGDNLQWCVSINSAGDYVAIGASEYNLNNSTGKCIIYLNNNVN